MLENAIKHNALTDESPLKITVLEEGDYITVENNLKPKPNKEVSTGQGLTNLAERYKLFSGDQLLIKQDQDTFKVLLKCMDMKIVIH